MTPFEHGPIERIRQRADTGLEVDIHKQRVGFGGLTLTRKWSCSPSGGPSGGPDGGPSAPPERKIVLVHGFAQNRYTWHATGRSPSTWFASQGFDVWNLELRGHGLSRGGGLGTDSSGFSDYVDDAVRLGEALGPALWIGHSLGGAVSYAAATRVHMHGVIGIGALYSFAQANRSLKLLCQLSTLLTSPKSPFAGVNIRTRLAGQLIGRLYGISDVAGYAFPISGWAPGSMEPELLAERMERGFDWTSLSIWMDMARWGTAGGFAWDEAWGATQVPLLVIAGDLDHLMPPADARMAFERSGSQDKQYLLLDDYTTGHHWGHLDLILGRQARTWVWEPILAWIDARVAPDGPRSAAPE